jgi:hypothetical protein
MSASSLSSADIKRLLSKTNYKISAELTNAGARFLSNKRNSCEKTLMRDCEAKAFYQLRILHCDGYQSETIQEDSEEGIRPDGVSASVSFYTCISKVKVKAITLST